MNTSLGILKGVDFTTPTVVAGSVPLVPVTDIAILGTMITAAHALDQFEYEQKLHAYGEKDLLEIMKKQLIHQLVEQLVSSKCVEFTKKIDAYQHRMEFRARMFVTPDSQVRALRTNGVK